MAITTKRSDCAGPHWSFPPGTDHCFHVLCSQDLRNIVQPERLLGGVKYNVQSEVWSFGIVLMELVVGRYPIPPVSASEFLAMRDTQRPLAMKRSMSRSNAAAYSTFDYIQCILNEVSEELGCCVSECNALLWYAIQPRPPDYEGVPDGISPRPQNPPHGGGSVGARRPQAIPASAWGTHGGGRANFCIFAFAFGPAGVRLRPSAGTVVFSNVESEAFLYL